MRSSETHGHQRRHAVAPQKRIYDIGAVTDHSVKDSVDYNGSTIPVKNFQQYVDLYIGPKQDAKRLYESPANAGYVSSVAHAPVRADLVCQRIATFGAGNT
jgi:hypothetical protein